MASKKRANPSSNSNPTEETEAEKKIPPNEIEAENENPPNDSTKKDNIKPMERRKKRKSLDKERHFVDTDQKPQVSKSPSENPDHSSSTSSLPGLHLDVFRDLASGDSSVRKAAVESLTTELVGVQKAYERIREDKRVEEEEGVNLEAEKDDGLENCAPSLRYAIRRLIRGVSSSRECARQGFALGLSTVVAKIPTIKVDSLMKLIVNTLEVSASMKGQEAKDNLLGRLFAYGSIATSRRLTSERFEDIDTSSVEEFVSHVIGLARKKRYLREPAISVIVGAVEKLPLEAVMNHVLEVPGIKECFQNAANIGDPDALLLALKLKDRIPMNNEVFGKLLPCPFSADKFFTRDHLLHLAPCFKESTFCHPRVHSIWQLLVDSLVLTLPSQEDTSSCARPGKKHKKSRKGGSFEEMTKNLRCFCEVVIEETLLFSSHERKHLVLMIILLFLPRLPSSCISIVLSCKLVQCLTDILATKGSNLHVAAEYFFKELNNWIGNDDDKCVSVIVALQKHSSGRFDSITKTQTVKWLVAKFVNSQGCLLFVRSVRSLFVDDALLTDEPSDQSQTTDENSEICSVEDEGYPGGSENADMLKNWIVNTVPRVLKNLKLDSNAKSLADTEIVKFLEEKFCVQAEILKFLAVQGLFSASLGTEVTSFELKEKFKWPKVAIPNSLRRMCIEQLQFLLEDAQKGEVSNAVPSTIDTSDLGSYFMCFLKTLCNIPSVSLYRTLSEKDQEAFKRLQEIESRLLQEERNISPGIEANKLHALRYMIIQLVLQVLLCPDEFNDAAFELAICCEKAFPSTTVHCDTIEEENELDDNEVPDLMDVLLETFLSLLPHSSGPMCFAIEQVFKPFCDDITVDGILRMLSVVKKDLKPLRHPSFSSDEDKDSDDDDDEDDFLGIEDLDETNKSKDAEGTGDEVTKDEEVDSEGIIEPDAMSDDGSDGDMDDDAMLMRDPAIAEIIKQRLSSGKGSALSQLLTFKSRVLTLLEIFLQKHPGKSQVLMIYTYLIQAYIKYHSAKEDQIQQLAMRIKGILQKKIFKAKDYPKGGDILLPSLEPLLEKSLKVVSRSTHKEVSSLAQAASFWLLKVVHSRNFDESELERVVKLFQWMLTDYFQVKKSRVKLGFLKEIFRRHPWTAPEIFGFLLDECSISKFEFRRIEALETVDCVMKSLIPALNKSSAKLLKKHLPALCSLIRVVLTQWPEKKARRAGVRRFCTRALKTISVLGLGKSFLKRLEPEACLLCETHLGDAFRPFKAATK